MVILDVREKEEFQSEHIADSIFCPLSQFDLYAPGILKNLKESDVTIMCRSGNRAKMALNELKKIDSGSHKFTVYEGGILKWKSEGRATVGQGGALPLMRQVHMIASSLIILSFLGSKFIFHDLVYLALFVGFGLALAGFVGFCPMLIILQKMPWNNKSISNRST
jgi:rhodanese-related sulfurtransferase